MTNNPSIDPYANDVVDPETQRLADFIGGFMTPAEEGQFKQQMIKDEAFFLRMAPFLAPWAGDEVRTVERAMSLQLKAKQEAERRAAAQPLDDLSIRRNRNRRLSFIAVATASTLQAKAIIVGSAATILVAVASLNWPSTSTPGAVTVQVPPPKAPMVSTPPAIAATPTRTPHQVIAAAHKDTTALIPYVVALDSATENLMARLASAAMASEQPALSGSAIAADSVQLAFNIPAVPTTKTTEPTRIDSTTAPATVQDVGRLERLKDGVRGAVGSIINPIVGVFKKSKK